jgi:hypothetical protein
VFSCGEKRNKKKLIEILIKCLFIRSGKNWWNEEKKKFVLIYDFFNFTENEYFLGSFNFQVGFFFFKSQKSILFSRVSQLSPNMTDCSQNHVNDYWHKDTLIQYKVQYRLGYFFKTNAWRNVDSFLQIFVWK